MTSSKSEAPAAPGPRWTGLLGWGVGSLLLVAWLVWGPAQIMRGTDYALMHHFMKGHLREAFWAGEMPFWNPYTWLGRPFLADPEVAAFYPPSWFFLFLPEPAAYWLVASLHLALGGWGFARLAKHWGAAAPAAVVSGVAFVLSPPFLGHLFGGLLGFICTIAWWPHLLLHTDRLCTDPRARDVLALSVLLAACFLAGHSHAFWLCGCSLGFFILPRCCAGGIGASLRRMLRAYGSLVIATCGAMAIGAIQLLPLLELSGEGNRDSGRDFAAALSLTREGLQSLWRPMPALAAGLWEGQLYIGLPILLLGVLQLGRGRDARQRALLVVAAAALALALGRATPFFDLLYPLVPAMGYFRCNNRFGMFVVWAIILAAASFWRGRNREPAPLWTEAAVGAVGVFALLARGAALGVGLAAAGGAVAGALVFAVGRRGRRAAPGLVFGFWLLAWGVDFTPAAVTFARELRACSPNPYASDSDLPAEIRAAIGPPRELAPTRLFLSHEILKANSGMVNGYSMVTGYGALSSARVWNYVHAATGVRQHPLFKTVPASEIHTGRGPFPFKGANILISWDSKQEQLVECPASELGTRAWLVRTVAPVADQTQALQAVADGFDPRGAVLLEPEAQPLAASVQPGAATGSARITAFGRNRVALSVTSTAPAILVLAEAWFPGWRAEVDGRATEVFPANVWMRGIVVPAGAHEVQFTYRPNYFWPGAAISLLSLATALAAWRKYRAEPPPTGAR